MVFNGSMTGFQPDGAGSNPAIRSKCGRSLMAKCRVVAPTMRDRYSPVTPLDLWVAQSGSNPAPQTKF